MRLPCGPVERGWQVEAELVGQRGPDGATKRGILEHLPAPADLGAVIRRRSTVRSWWTSVMAGRAGGCGNAVKINHGGNLATRYCHMSRVATSSGQRVRQGQIIGYVGSTGLSTGPHLHYELYKNGSVVNPLSVKFTQRAQLSGSDLARFKSQLARLKSVKPGAALSSTGGARKLAATPDREIDRISAAQNLRRQNG